MNRDDWKTLGGYILFFLLVPVVMFGMGAIVNAPDGYVDLGKGQFIERAK